MSNVCQRSCGSLRVEATEDTEERRVLLALADVVVGNPVPWVRVMRDLRGQRIRCLKKQFFEEVLPTCMGSLWGSKPVIRGRINEDAFFTCITATREKRANSNLYNKCFRLCVRWRMLWFGWMWRDLEQRLAKAEQATTQESFDKLLVCKEISKS